MSRPNAEVCCNDKVGKRTKPMGTFDAIDLLGLVRTGPATSFTLSELSDLTGRARSTVALRLDELLEAGLVATLPETHSTGGRPSARVAFNPTTWGVIAIDLGLAHHSVALMDLGAEVLAEASFDAKMTDGPESVLGAAVAASRSLLLGLDAFRVAAVGIALPLPVFHDGGRPVNATNLPEWDGFDVPAFVTREFAAPVQVDNDANLMALGEHLLRPEIAEMIAVEASTGIGSGIISSGNLVRGAKGTAGAIGHIPIARGSEVQCICGNRGCLAAMAGGPAIARSLRAAGLAAENVDDVVELARNGNLVAINAIRQAGNDIGEVLTTCVSFFNPALIAVGGRLATAGDHLVAGIREVVFQKGSPFATEGLTIVRSLEPERAGLIGAGLMAIECALTRDSLSRLLAS